MWEQQLSAVHAPRDVILNGGEAAVRDLTSAASFEVVNKNAPGACSDGCAATPYPCEIKLTSRPPKTCYTACRI
jgi:hypothetical protein